MNHRVKQVPARRALMHIQTQALDEAGQVVFQKQFEVDGHALMLAAETREDQVRSIGRDFTEGAIPFFGGELVKAAQSGRSQTELERGAFNVVMFVWLLDSIFDGVTREAFMNSDLRFTMLPDGAVAYDRIPVT